LLVFEVLCVYIHIATKFLEQTQRKYNIYALEQPLLQTKTEWLLRTDTIVTQLLLQLQKSM